MSNLLQGLNAPQRAAVSYGDGPLLIFAGAGSGKTRTLTHRIAHLVTDRNVSPSRILAVTFTNKAAAEMRQRLTVLIGEGARRIWMGTFHAMCAQMLRISGTEIGIDPRFVIFDSDDTTRLMKDIVKSADLDSDRFPASRALHKISEAKNNLLQPEDMLSVAASPPDKIYARLYRTYQDRLRASNALDFDDLLVEAVRLLRESARAQQYWSERFLYTLIDEFQDVNAAQFAWAQALASTHRNICVVGDDDQSIYGWRGANVKIILDFERTYPDAEIIRLEQNYRSTQNILDAAHGVISKNLGRASKRLWTEEGGGEPIIVHGSGNAQEEASWVVRQIQTLARERRCDWSDFAILCRVNSQSRTFEEAFMRARIPLRMVGTQRFYERKEIKDLVSYLKLIYNPRDDVAMSRLINVPARGIGNVTIEKLKILAGQAGRSMFEVIDDAALCAELGKVVAAKLQPLREVLLQLQGDANALESVADVIASVVDRVGYIDFLRRETTVESVDRIANVQELVKAAEEFDNRLADERANPVELPEEDLALRGPESALGLFLESSALEGGTDAGSNGDAVTFMTLHSAKGLEFPVVFLAGMEQGLLPHMRALRGESQNDDELEEERRLCYVGLTRAREQVFVTYAAQRTMNGRTDSTIPSQFIDEMPTSLLKRSGLATGGSSLFRESTSWGGSNSGAFTSARTMPTYSPSSRNDEPSTFAIGERVKHARFGEGLVVSTSPGKGAGEWVEVAFLGTGIGKKRLGVAYAGLEKVNA